MIFCRFIFSFVISLFYFSNIQASRVQFDFSTLPNNIGHFEDKISFKQHFAGFNVGLEVVKSGEFRQISLGGNRLKIDFYDDELQLLKYSTFTPRSVVMLAEVDAYPQIVVNFTSRNVEFGDFQAYREKLLDRLSQKPNSNLINELVEDIKEPDYEAKINSHVLPLFYWWILFWSERSLELDQTYVSTISDLHFGFSSRLIPTKVKFAVTKLDAGDYLVRIRKVVSQDVIYKAFSVKTMGVFSYFIHPYFYHESIDAVFSSEDFSPILYTSIIQSHLPHSKPIYISREIKLSYKD